MNYIAYYFGLHMIILHFLDIEDKITKTNEFEGIFAQNPKNYHKYTFFFLTHDRNQNRTESGYN